MEGKLTTDDVKLCVWILIEFFQALLQNTQKQLMHNILGCAFIPQIAKAKLFKSSSVN